jgi:hypothetical protein
LNSIRPVTAFRVRPLDSETWPSPKGERNKKPAY